MTKIIISIVMIPIPFLSIGL